MGMQLQELSSDIPAPGDYELYGLCKVGGVISVLPWPCHKVMYITLYCILMLTQRGKQI